MIPGQQVRTSVPCNAEFAKHGGKYADQEQTRMSETHRQNGRPALSFCRKPCVDATKMTLQIAKKWGTVSQKHSAFNFCLFENIKIQNSNGLCGGGGVKKRAT